MKRVTGAILCSILLMWGCAGKKKEIDRSTSNGIAEVEGAWEYPGHETEVMRMLFKPLGQLIFQDGFKYHNPASWTYSPDLEELILVITIPKDFDLSTLKFQMEQRRIKRFEPVRGEIVYRFPRGTKSIDFQGWIFFKK